MYSRILIAMRPPRVTEPQTISIEEFDMSDLIEAFRQMRHAGLIARRVP